MSVFLICAERYCALRKQSMHWPAKIRLHAQKWTTWSMLSTTCCNVVLHPVNNNCSQLFTVNNHCSIIVDNHQQACFINYCRLLFQQHCNNYCSLSTSNNCWSNNSHQHCQFNKCCWTLITTLFRRCWTNNVASTWWIFARVLWNRTQSAGHWVTLCVSKIPNNSTSFFKSLVDNICLVQ